MTALRTVGIIVFVLRRLEGRCEVLFLRRSGGRYGDQWWPVGGTCKVGEAPLETMLRELAEETGLTPRAVYSFGEDIPHVDGRSRIEAFVAFVGDEPVQLDHEHSEHKWLSADEALTVVIEPKHILRLRELFMVSDPVAPALYP